MHIYPSSTVNIFPASNDLKFDYPMHVTGYKILAFIDTDSRAFPCLDRGTWSVKFNSHQSFAIYPSYRIVDDVIVKIRSQKALPICDIYDVGIRV